MKDYDDKIEDIDKWIKFVLNNMDEDTYVSYVTDILEKSYQSIVDKYGEDWVDSRIGKKDE